MRQLVDAEPAARAAGALRVVEDEVVGADVAVDEVMRRAAERLVEAVGVRLAGALRALCDDVDLQQPVAHEERGGDARLDGLLVPASDDEAVHDGVDVADVRIVDGGLLGQIDGLTVENQPAAAFLANLGEHELEVFAVDLEDRRAQLDFGALRQREDGLENLTGRAVRRGLARSRAVRLPDGRKEQVEVARDVRHRADGGPRVVGERLLLDGDDRRQAENEVDVGLGNLGHEPLGESRERFHVAPLALGVDGVERQARLARAGETGDDDEAVARDLDRDVLEVVHARALNGDGRAGGGSRAHRGVHSSSSVGRAPGSARHTNASSWTSTVLFRVSRARTDTLLINS